MCVCRRGRGCSCSHRFDAPTRKPLGGSKSGQPWPPSSGQSLQAGWLAACQAPTLVKGALREQPVARLLNRLLSLLCCQLKPPAAAAAVWLKPRGAGTPLHCTALQASCKWPHHRDHHLFTCCVLLHYATQDHRRRQQSICWPPGWLVRAGWPKAPAKADASLARLLFFTLVPCCLGLAIAWALIAERPQPKANSRGHFSAAQRPRRGRRRGMFPFWAPLPLVPLTAATAIWRDFGRPQAKVEVEACRRL